MAKDFSFSDDEVQPEDMEPVDVKTEGDNVTPITGDRPKRRGRPPLPRDENGNIIRSGNSGSSSRSPRRRSSGGKPSPENREERYKQIVVTYNDVINPMLVQVECMIAGVNPQLALGLNPKTGEKYYTALGSVMCLPDQIVDLHAQAFTRVAETPLAIKIGDKIGGITPYLLVLMAAGATTLWAVQMLKMKEQFAAISKQAQASNVKSATEFNQRQQDQNTQEQTADTLFNEMKVEDIL